MPIAPTYPGVYIQEIPSGVRTITGAATSVAAFLGRAPTGPVNQPVAISSYGDYERVFGGLSLDSSMSYSIRDFFANGGSNAVVVRLYANPAAAASNTSTDVAPDGAEKNVTAATSSKSGKSSKNSSDSSTSETSAAEAPTSTKDGIATFNLGGLTFNAASPGSYGNSITLSVDKDGITKDVAAAFGSKAITEEMLFNLTVKCGEIIETFSNLTFIEGPRRIDRVLEQRSRFVRCVVPASAEDIKTDDLAKSTTNPVSLANGADSLALDSTTFIGKQSEKTGLYALEDADGFNLLCIPPDSRTGNTDNSVYSEALAYCVKRRAILLVDPPSEWASSADAAKKLAGMELTGLNARNAAIYFPRIVQADPLRQGQPDTFAPCGTMAGVIAATDARRGIWKAPAGLDAAISGIQGLATKLNDADSGLLNPAGINCLRTFPAAGSVVWGARTLRGADQLADEYKYLPIRRLALHIEESLYRGSQWAVHEPNDEPLWSHLRLNIGSFMHDLFRKGAFQGKSPKEAYFVSCDSSTTTQNDIDKGIVNVVVGFAPLKPAEFVIIQLQQMAGQVGA